MTIILPHASSNQWAVHNAMSKTQVSFNYADYTLGKLFDAWLWHNVENQCDGDKQQCTPHFA